MSTHITVHTRTHPMKARVHNAPDGNLAWLQMETANGSVSLLGSSARIDAMHRAAEAINEAFGHFVDQPRGLSAVEAPGAEDVI